MSRTPILNAALALLSLAAPFADSSAVVHAASPAASVPPSLQPPVMRVHVQGQGVVNVSELSRGRSGNALPPLRSDLAEPRPLRVSGSQSMPSPSPSFSFPGLDDLPSVDSGDVVVPPDVNGAVGPTRIFQNLKNNVRILEKSTGAVVSTVGINTFWAPAGATPDRYSDPRSVYDPYQGRFISVMLANLGLTFSNSIVLGLSDSNDPGAGWHLYRIPAFVNSTYQGSDFPNLGFNRNWIVITFNAYSLPPTIGRRSVFLVHYPTLRDQHSAIVYRVNDSTPDLICASPCVTYSATCDTAYVVQRRGTDSYSLDLIRGTGPAAPVYEIGPTLTRPGGEWNALGDIGNSLPQSAPVLGASACGNPPCPIERSDDHVRAPGVHRDGSIWFAQQVGLPASDPAYVAVQWTRIAAPGGGYVAGGRLQDTLATATNGRPHYSYPSIAVNANGDFLLGFNRFSSSQHPAAGYALHLAADGPGTLRDTVIFKDGEDYYHRLASASSTRNRWGDFSTSQVDPADDRTLWTVQQYSRHRDGTDDGNTLANSSRWGTWWAGVIPPATVDVPAAGGPRPTGFAILAAVPNPGRGGLLIRFAAPRPARLRLTLFDLQGREIARLVDAPFEAGEHEVRWDGDSPAGPARSGVYIARLETPDGSLVRRLMLVR